MEDQMKTFFDLAKDLEQQTTRDHITNVTGVDFNPSYFKASREVSWMNCGVLLIKNCSIPHIGVEL